MTAPAKFVHDEDGRRGAAISSVIAGGSIVSGATLRRSLVFTGVRVHSYADVAYAVILPEVDIGNRGASAQRHHRARRAHPRRAGGR